MNETSLTPAINFTVGLQRQLCSEVKASLLMKCWLKYCAKILRPAALLLMMGWCSASTWAAKLPYPSYELLEPAREALRLRQYEKAFALTNSVLEAKPRDANARSLRAAIEVDLGRVDDAIKDYRRCIELEPVDNLRETRELGALLFLKGQYKESLSLFREASNEYKARGWEIPHRLPYDLWMARLKLGQNARAWKDLHVYVEHTPKVKCSDLDRTIGNYLVDLDSEEQLLSVNNNSLFKQNFPEWFAYEQGVGWFYIGLKKEFAGDKKGAVEAFEHCGKFTEAGKLTLLLAEAELAQLQQR